ncbi:amino acid ABC transporter permease [Promicromonospora sp. MS192]|uniref:amino acid ABC transporter permease n=1 Tax=Promicromonospora sp. MS192 TaxID=3412684 RepID=UPI003C2EC31E
MTARPADRTAPTTRTAPTVADAGTSRLSPPPRAVGLAVAALTTAVLLLVAAGVVGGAVASTEEREPTVAGLAVGVVGVGLGAGIAWYAARGLRLAHSARRQDADGDRLTARELAARSRAHSLGAFSTSLTLVLLLAVVVVLTANDASIVRTFFDPDHMAASALDVTRAFGLNLVIAVGAMAFVLVLGLVLAVVRMLPGDGARPLRALAIAYIDVMRAIPSIIVLYLIGFGLPLAGFPLFSGLPPAWYAIIALTLTYSAYVAEIYRAGIEAVHPSQTGAARSLGLSYGRTLRHVVLPQAVRGVVPPLLSAFIALQKDTALVSIIGAVDAFSQAKFFASSNFNLSSVAVVAALFVIITIPQARLVDWLLARDASRRGTRRRTRSHTGSAR